MRSLALLALSMVLGTACGGSTDEPEDPPVDAPDEPLPDAYGHEAPDPPDPCLTGEIWRIDGHLVRVPIPCAPPSIDQGDPSPVVKDDAMYRINPADEKSSLPGPP